MRDPVLLLAPRRDRLAAELARQLGHNASWMPGPGFSASMRVDPLLGRATGCCIVGNRVVEWHRAMALVVRPHAAWAPSRRFASVVEGFTAHEQRAALCAMMAAFPGMVANRLPPSWFIDRQVTGRVLAQELTVCASVRLSTTVGRPPAPMRAWVSGDRVFAASTEGAASEAFADWVGSWAAVLPAWRQACGVHWARMEGEQDALGWSLRLVDIAPPSGALCDTDLANIVRGLMEVFE